MAAILKRQQDAGEISRFEFEGIRLSIGDGVTYTPDFHVRLNSGLPRFVEVKGAFIREDSLVKWKCAKAIYTFAEFQLWELTKEGWNRIA